MRKTALKDIRDDVDVLQYHFARTLENQGLETSEKTKALVGIIDNLALAADRAASNEAVYRSIGLAFAACAKEPALKNDNRLSDVARHVQEKIIALRFDAS